MSDHKKPVPGSDEHWAWVRKRAEARGKQLANAGPADFEDECGVISGSVKILFASDAELFPDELENYTPEELEAYYAKKLAEKKADTP
ncbi:MAG: hypothetical protein V4732_12285 [Pseudomonadota bacterium]